MNMKSKLLVLHDNQVEHELFRKSMQLVVGVRQGHSLEMLRRYADQLEASVLMHVGIGDEKFTIPATPNTKEP